MCQIAKVEGYIAVAQQLKMNWQTKKHCLILGILLKFVFYRGWKCLFQNHHFLKTSVLKT